MPAPTVDRRDLHTGIAFIRAAAGEEAAPHLVRFAGMIGAVLDGNGLTITTPQWIA